MRAAQAGIAFVVGQDAHRGGADQARWRRVGQTRSARLRSLERAREGERRAVVSGDGDARLRRHGQQARIRRELTAGDAREREDDFFSFRPGVDVADRDQVAQLRREGQAAPAWGTRPLVGAVMDGGWLTGLMLIVTEAVDVFSPPAPSNPLFTCPGPVPFRSSARMVSVSLARLFRGAYRPCHSGRRSGRTAGPAW